MPSPIDGARRWAPALLLLLPVSLQAQPRGAEPPLDEVGYAAVMEGPGTMAVRGAHRALPAPSYVEVTALDNGHTILVEIAAQGMQAPGAVIALSCGAVRQLGLSAIPAAVRVRRVSPPDQERAVLSAGQKAAARLDAPAGLLSALRRKLPPVPKTGGQGDCGLPSGAPVPPPPPPLSSAIDPLPKSAPSPKAVLPPKAAPIMIVPAEKPRPVVQPPKGPAYVIQVAALSDRARADALARSVGGHVVKAGGVFRVRTGPYASQATARAALPSLRAKGFADARVMPNEGH